MTAGKCNISAKAPETLGFGACLPVSRCLDEANPHPKGQCIGASRRFFLGGLSDMHNLIESFI